MLNGLDPIIIFRIVPDAGQLALTGLSGVANFLGDTLGTKPFIPVPIYLSERLTGLYIDTEDKNIDIETSVETLATSNEAVYSQKGINSTVKINLTASKDSIGMTLLAALSDVIFTKVTSKEYAIDYLHGAVTVFGGLLHSFSIGQNSNNDLYNISIELQRTGVKTQAKTAVPTVENVRGVLP